MAVKKAKPEKEKGNWHTEPPQFDDDDQNCASKNFHLLRHLLEKGFGSVHLLDFYFADKSTFSLVEQINEDVS